MNISEPEPWSFKDEDQFKKYEVEDSSTDDSDDEDIFSKKIKGKRFNKIVEKEKLSFE
jgi:hypothetical protein|tara:strand:+ start:9518 stop:9691 length:174 start_codon:yes stop_codon:yes gene_type:complete